LGGVSLLAAAMSPALLLTIRLLRDVVFVRGSEAGFYPTFLFTLVTVSPYSLLIGFSLPYSLFVLRQESPGFKGTTVYIMDNIGDIAGGALFSFVLLFIATPLQSTCFASLLLTAAAAGLLGRRGILSPVSFIGIVGTAIVVSGPVLIETRTLKPPGGDLAWYRESRSGRIQVERQADQFTLFLDGVPVASTGNRQEAEEAAHYPLSQVDEPGDVLLIAAESGIVEEINKHHPRSIDYVEIDPEVAGTMFRFGLLDKTNRMNVIHEDARAFLSRSTRRYDAIIMCLPEPETYQLNRFYTFSFFSLIRQRLTEKGVFSFSLQGFDNYPSEPDRQKLSTVYNTAAACFPEVLLLPGENVFFLCGQSPLTADIPRRLEQKGIETDYIAAFFEGNITPERMNYLKSIIDASTPGNRDIRPRLMRLMFARWFSLFDTSPAFFYAAGALFLLVYWSLISRGQFVLFSSGFANMASEILAIFAFQIFFGYIYFQIGWIVTVFLGGLLPGAWLGERARHHSRRTVMLLDGALVVLAGGFAVAVMAIGHDLSLLFFLVYGFVFSCICGFQFPAILRLFGDRNRQATGAFSADLIGAAFGALITSTLLIPYTGLAGTALAIMGLKTASMVITGTSHDIH
jgi:spermidine synthase